MEQTENKTPDSGFAEDEDQQDNGKPFDESDSSDGEHDKSGEEKSPIKRPSWPLVQSEAFTENIQEYWCQRRKALLEALIDLRECRSLSKEGDQHLGVPA